MSDTAGIYVMTDEGLLPGATVPGPPGPAGPAGPEGNDGSPGSRWTAGLVYEPYVLDNTGDYSFLDIYGTPVVGVDGDQFLDANTGNVYEWMNGGWTATGNIKGPQGETGGQGVQGDAGPQNLFVQDTNPNMTSPGLWIDTSNGDISLWIEDGN
jgi:hypothetical protein